MLPRAKKAGIRRLRRFPLLAGLATVTGALVFTWSTYQVHTQYHELDELRRASGAALAEALGHAVEDALVSGDQFEKLAKERLLDKARLLNLAEAGGGLTAREIEALGRELRLDCVLLLDSARRPDPDSSTDSNAVARRLAATPRLMDRVFDASPEARVLGTAPWFGNHLGVAATVPRSGGGALVVVVDVAKMSPFEQTTVAAHLLDSVAGTGGVDYLSLEDYRRQTIAGHRPTTDEGDGQLSFHRTVPLADGRDATLWVGLSNQAHLDALERSRLRSVLFGLAFAGMVFFVGAAALTRQRAVMLRREAERVRAARTVIFERMVDAVMLLDENGVVQLVNPAAAQLLCCARGLVGKRCESDACATVAGLLHEPGHVHEIAVERPDNTRVPLLATVSPIQSDDGSAIGTAILMRDLSRIRELEEITQRAESLSALGRLGTSLAHEVRNPLNAIAVGVQRIGREFRPKSDDEGFDRLVELLRSEISRLDHYVERFLDVARAPYVEVRDVDVDAVLRETLPLLEPAVPNNVSVSIESSQACPSLVDSRALRQVLLNLVRNAVEAMDGRGGRILLRAAQTADATTLEVIDDGPGIPEEHLDKVFRFGFTTRRDGTGIGLALVDRLVREMQGSISIHSEVGTGTTIRITFPASVQARTA